MSSKLPKRPLAEESVISQESQFAASNDQRFYADLPESFWFATGSFLQQGTEVIPKTSAGEDAGLLYWKKIMPGKSRLANMSFMEEEKEEKFLN